MHFSEDWAEQCKQVDDLLELLSKQEGCSKIQFFKVLATDVPEAASKHDVSAVPTVLLFRNNQLIDRIEGVDTKTITQKIMKYKDFESLEDRLKNLINYSKVMLFMKGSKGQPRCGFSRQIVDILNNLGLVLLLLIQSDLTLPVLYFQFLFPELIIRLLTFYQMKK